MNRRIYAIWPRTKIGEFYTRFNCGEVLHIRLGSQI